MVENRRVGIKSRETYECPGMLALMLAHADLESITLERDVAREKSRLEPRYSELVYDGLWFSPLREAFDAFIDSHPAPRDRRGAPAARAGPVLRRRAAGPSAACTTTTLATYEAERRVPPRGRGRLRAAVGPVGRDVVAPPAHRGAGRGARRRIGDGR